MIPRRPSKPVRIGDVTIGGDAPVVVQSMTNTDTRDTRATVDQIARLAERGCELVRLAVPSMEAAAALNEICRASKLPLIADIHFDHRLALAALDAGIHALRLNPGNIRDPRHVSAVVQAARERDCPIRIGVNAGSLPPAGDWGASEIRSRLAAAPAGALSETSARMVSAALGEIALLESLDFDLIKVSLKAFDVSTTVEAYRAIADLIPYPLHLGITEAGTPRVGSIRSAVGIGTLLCLGIGDTLRVSLTGDPCEEIDVAYEILKSLGLREHGPTLISCPGCGRTEIALEPLARAVEDRLRLVGEPIKVAVMGCVVNGPGEAREADIGIAGGKGRAAIFRGGRVVRTVSEDEALPALLEELESLRAERASSTNIE
ncbi:MAG: flavodoxin-dependent (E)-4-hydroxy-3-methylbut-2-enyl-diphosphate synthase [Chloroflexota bacterium]|nr:MAG: flavodoxin-dependent (E)-4-hydroxy-3-methylbut-2-enyl-diphosphate synthase [Chloroflexota bacterium]